METIAKVQNSVFDVKIESLPLVATWNEAQAIVAIKLSITIGDDQRKATGRLLLEAKQNIPHGDFQVWCSTNFPERPYRTLSLWMNLALKKETLEDKSAMAALLSSNDGGEPPKVEWPRFISVEMQKLEDLRNAPKGTIAEPAKMIARQEAKVEKLMAKVSPPIDTRPPCPGKEGHGYGEWYWISPNGAKPGRWDQMETLAQYQERCERGRQEQAKLPIQERSMGTEEAEKILGINPMPREVLQAIFRFQASQNHPDKGGSTEKMQLINKAYEVLQHEYF